MCLCCSTAKVTQLDVTFTADEKIFHLEMGNELCHEQTCLQGFRPGLTNWAVQPSKLVRDYKFQIKEVEGLYYVSSEDKGADQLCCYRTDDLHFCFCVCKKAGFLIHQNKLWNFL